MHFSLINVIYRFKEFIIYVPTSADFEDEKLGGRKDKNLRQLSGAQTKWYHRALFGGDTPEIALTKARHRGCTQAAPKG